MRRRVRILFGAGITGSVLVIAAGALLVYTGSAALPAHSARLHSIAALALVSVSQPVFFGAAGPLWALHHASQKTELRGISM